jgi:hypothetical protein
MTSENTSVTINSFHRDLKLIKALVYDRCGFDLTNPKMGTESAEYGACSFALDGATVQHRVSKITPAKTGQFVTIWKRNKNGITAPFDISDNLDFLVITSGNDERLGQFIFPTPVLAGKGIITANNKQGKRGIRVYPPWDIVTSKQAEKTQTWQTTYFLEIENRNSADIALAKRLFSKINFVSTIR